MRTPVYWAEATSVHLCAWVSLMVGEAPVLRRTTTKAITPCDDRPDAHTAERDLRARHLLACLPRARRLGRPRSAGGGRSGRVAARAADHDGRRQPRRRLPTGALARGLA